MLAWLDLNRQIFAGDSHFRSQLPRATEALLTTTKHLNVPHMHICLVPICSRSLSDKEPIGPGSTSGPACAGGSTGLLLPSISEVEVEGTAVQRRQMQLGYHMWLYSAYLGLV
jgi:hypothetical protein